MPLVETRPRALVITSMEDVYGKMVHGKLVHRILSDAIRPYDIGKKVQGKFQL